MGPRVLRLILRESHQHQHRVWSKIAKGPFRPSRQSLAIPSELLSGWWGYEDPAGSNRGPGGKPTSPKLAQECVAGPRHVGHYGVHKSTVSSYRTPDSVPFAWLSCFVELFAETIGS